MRLVLLHFAASSAAQIQATLDALGARPHPDVRDSWLYPAEAPSLQARAERGWPLNPTLRTSIQRALGGEPTFTLELNLSVLGSAAHASDLTFELLSRHQGVAHIELGDTLWRAQRLVPSSDGRAEFEQRLNVPAA